ncbi:MAG TPA: type II secretion system F family protein, partial [Alphaproteobacteria bacterium]|nr:type II secretion system F family protein [Alphaproteobacteria bacterium]
MQALADNPQLMIAISAALSVFSAIIVVSWPYLARDNLGTRLRQVSSERERIRARERAKLEAQKKQASLRSEPKKFFKDMVARFNLAKQAEDGAMVGMLRQAGFRGQNPVFVFPTLRLAMPILMFALAALYVFLILRLEKPLFMKLGIVLAVS